MKQNVIFAAASFFLIIPVPAQESPSPPLKPSAQAELSWTSNVGSKMNARFVRLSGDVLVLVVDGRERQIEMSKLSEESARQARKLAGVPEPLAEHPVELPAPLLFVNATTSRLETGNTLRAGRVTPTMRQAGFIRFKMGSPTNEVGREANEPLHRVRFTREFQLKATEVTWNEWKSVQERAHGFKYTDLTEGRNGQGGGEDGNHPVVGISWWDVVKWCNLLSQIELRKPVYYSNAALTPAYVVKTGIPELVAVDWTANGYRLPTEAEWEFACRQAISEKAFHTGDISNTGLKDHNLDEAGWFLGNSNGSTHPVGGKTPNRFGLFDMHGNVAEWCWDIEGTLKTEDVIDPRGATKGESRVIRGGSWLDSAEHCRAAYRGSLVSTADASPSVGFRPARTVDMKDRKRN